MSATNPERTCQASALRELVSGQSELSDLYDSLGFPPNTLERARELLADLMHGILVEIPDLQEFQQEFQEDIRISVMLPRTMEWFSAV